MSNPFTALIQAARDLISSAHECTTKESQVPTEAVVRLRHAAARAATALATPPTSSECAVASNERARAGVAETALGVTGAGDPPLLSLGQGDFAHGLDAQGKAFPPYPRASTYPIARTAEGQDIEVGPNGYVEPHP